MKILVVAVGHKPPDWAEAATAEYLKRFPPELRVELKPVKAEPRDGRPPAALMQAEARRIEPAIPRGSRRVALDEHGTRVTTRALAERLTAWQHDARDVAILIGGPDGLDAALKAGCDEALRLSDLTLPHALVRVLVAEALYASTHEARAAVPPLVRRMIAAGHLGRKTGQGFYSYCGSAMFGA